MRNTAEETHLVSSQDERMFYWAKNSQELAHGERIDNLQASPLLAPVFSPLLSLTTQLPSDSFCGNASCLTPMTSFVFLLFWSDISLKHETQIQLIRSDPISSSVSLFFFTVIAYSSHFWILFLLLMNKTTVTRWYIMFPENNISNSARTTDNGVKFRRK